MSQRSVLVMVSQAPALGPLPEIEDLGNQLWELLIRPDRGGGVGADLGLDPASVVDCENRAEDTVLVMPDGSEEGLRFQAEPGLLVNPTSETANDVFARVFKQANQKRQVLVFCFIGHAVVTEQGMVRLCFINSPPSPDADKSLDLLYRVSDLIRSGAWLRFLGIVDACHSGVAALNAIQWWASDQVRFKYELVTSTGKFEAYSACFTRRLIELIADGDPEGAETRLSADSIQAAIHGKCASQDPLKVDNPEFPSDPDLWLTINQAAWTAGHFAESVPLIAEEISRLTDGYDADPALADVLDALDHNQLVSLVGGTGTGKSTMAAALTRPELHPDSDTEDPIRVHGIVFCDKTPQVVEAVNALHKQLSKSVPGFRKAADDYLKQLTFDRRESLSTEQLGLLGPLHHSDIAQHNQIVVVIDAYDRLDLTRSDITALIRQLIDADVKVVVTSRTPLEELTDLDPVEAGHGWLLSRLQRQIHDLPGQMTSPETLGACYEVILDHTATLLENRFEIGQNADLWEGVLGRVLAPLTVSPPGATVPIRLLTDSILTDAGTFSHEFDHGTDMAVVRMILGNMGDLIARADPGSDNEHCGLFHQTLNDYLQEEANPTYAIEAGAARQALLDAINKAASAATTPLRADPDIVRFARTHAAQLQWDLDRPEDAITALQAWPFDRPADNLGQWQAWQDRISQHYGSDHRYTFTTRSEIAYWTGESGNPTQALRLYQELLPDQERILGPDNPDIFTTRGNIAKWTGTSGNPVLAWRLAIGLLPDQERVLGRNDPNTLSTRHQIAYWTGEYGNTEKALRLFRRLQRQQKRALGRRDPDTLQTRHNIARLTGETGNPRKALRLSKKLLPDMTRVHGPDQPDTLNTRSVIAQLTGETGNPLEALRLFRELLPDQERVLGTDHPGALAARGLIAYWTGRTGDPPEALRLFRELLPDQEWVLGTDHPDTLNTRGNIAYWTAESGNRTEALRLFKELLPDQERFLPRGHPHTLSTRNSITVLEDDGFGSTSDSCG